jgi:hypothetical protein
VAQAVEHLLCKCEALNSNVSATKKKKERERKGRREGGRKEGRKEERKKF